MIDDRVNPSAKRWMGALRLVFFSLLAGGTIAVWLYREPARNLVFAECVLANDAPTESAIEQVIDSAADRLSTVRKVWDTGKIVHKEVSIRQLSRLIPAGEPIPASLESWILTATVDPDMNVREVALAILRDHSHPSLVAGCLAQIRDPDPELRLLGLNNISRVKPGLGVPLVMSSISDSDPLVVVSGLRLLEHWTGQAFGATLAETMPVENETTGLKEYREGSAIKAKAGAERAKAWWAAHHSEFPPVSEEVSLGAIGAPPPVQAGDFALSTLEGRRVKLSDFRGKIVLINFWTTWCPACVGEIPALIELRKRHGDHLAILGVSLDSVPDEHGHMEGDDGVEPKGSSGGHVEDRASRDVIRKKVSRVAITRGINYPILLDEKYEVGARFNGGELPTTVIIDAQGNVRRRFVGARSLPVFEAMIAEAGQPALSTGKNLVSSLERRSLQAGNE